MHTIGELIRVKANDPDADFWVARRGTVNEVGKPSKMYSKEAYGIKVLKPDVLLPDYLYYLVMHLQSSGGFRPKLRGSTPIVSITTDAIYGAIENYFRSRAGS